MSRPPSAAEEAEKVAWLRTWEEDRGRLLLERPFLGALAMQLQLVPVVDHRLRTAATDGRHVWFNPFFLAGCTPVDRIFVLAHEIWHVALLHPLRRGGRDPRRWNVAVDHEVNALLRADGFPLPPKAVWFSKLDGMSAEEVYATLDDDAPTPAPLDQHLEPGPAGHAALPSDGWEGSGEGADEGEGEPVVDPAYAPWDTPREVWEPWPGRTLWAASQARARGLLSGRVETTLRTLHTPPSVDWRTALRAFTTQAFGAERCWNTPSRRHVHRGAYLPSLRTSALRAAVAVDTSGSTHALLPQFLNELHGILSSYANAEVTVVWADSAVQRVETWRASEPPDPAAISVPLGLGTDFRPAFAYFEAEGAPRVLLYLTDGQGPAPTDPPAWPVLWVLAPGCEAPAGWGEVVVLG